MMLDNIDLHIHHNLIKEPQLFILWFHDTLFQQFHELLLILLDPALGVVLGTGGQQVQAQLVGGDQGGS